MMKGVVAQQCFCGCGRTVRFTKRRASSFGRSVAERVDELIAARTRLPEDYVPILAEITKVGQELAREWQHIAHGDRLITGGDRLETDAFMQDSERLLAFSRLDTDAQHTLDQSIGAGADVDEVERSLGL
jgi:hypothetical protein